MRSIALAMATILVFGAATVATSRAQEVEIEEAPSDEGADDIMSGPKRREPAAPEIQYGAKGFYGIVAGTYGIEDLKNLKHDVEDDTGARSAEFDNTLGLNLRVGDRWHPNLATEVEFEWLDSFDLEQPQNYSGKGGVGEIWSFTVNQKAFLSTGKFQPFLLVGIGALGAADAETPESPNPTPPPAFVLENQGGSQGTGFGVKVGGGFNYYFNEHFGLNTDFGYNIGTGSINDLRFTSFSWGFIFHP